jgi:hypothetical protein
MQSIAGASVWCNSYGNAYGCATAQATSESWATAHASGLAEAWAGAWAGEGCSCKNTAAVTADGLAELQVKLLAFASADVFANACVSGAPI